MIGMSARVSLAAGVSVVLVCTGLAAPGAGDTGLKHRDPQPAVTPEPPADVHEGAVSADPEDVVEYWTPEKIKGAKPKPLPPHPPHGHDDGPGERSIPKKQIMTPGGDRNGLARVKRPYTGNPVTKFMGVVAVHDPVADYDFNCSATLVDTPVGARVLTAAHCMFDSGAKSPKKWYWYQHLAFIPAYGSTRTGEAPHGVWPLVGMKIPGTWMNSSDWWKQWMYDLALLKPWETGPDGDIGTAVGRGLPTRSTVRDEDIQGFTMYGYPADKPYSGKPMYWCRGNAREESDKDPEKLHTPNCHAFGGNSGGGVVADGAVVGVVTHGADDSSKKGDADFSRLGAKNFAPMLTESADADMAVDGKGGTLHKNKKGKWHLKVGKLRRGKEGKYYLSVTNKGPSTATWGSATATLPSYLSYKKVAGKGCAKQDSKTITCRWSSLKSGQKVKFYPYIKISKKAKGVKHITVSVKAGTLDPHHKNNQIKINGKIS